MVFIEYAQSILTQCSIPIPPENVRKPELL